MRRREAAGRIAPPIEAPIAKAESTPPAEAEARPIAGGRRSVRRAALAGAAISAALLGALSFSSRAHKHPDLVVIPPFANETGDTAVDAMALLFANSLTQDLAATGLVSVGDFGTLLRDLPRAVAGGPPATAAEVAQRSGASVIVLGAIHRRRDSLAVDARLVRTKDNGVLSAMGPIMGLSSDPDHLRGAVREAILGAVAAAVDAGGNLLGAPPGRPPTYAAQLEYTLGLAAEAADVSRAEGHFHRAIDLDSMFAAPKLQLLADGDSTADSLLASGSARRGLRVQPTEALRAE